MRDEKKYIVEEFANRIRTANPIVFTDYSRVKANDLNQLRANLKSLNSRYTVVQNSLFQKALNSVGLEKITSQLTGPIAVAYGGKDVVEVLKVLIKYVKGYPDIFIIKGGVVDKQYFEFSGLEKLSKLPSKEVLLARLVGQMNAPLFRFAMVLRGNLQKLVYVLDGIAKKK